MPDDVIVTEGTTKMNVKPDATKSRIGYATKVLLVVTSVALLINYVETMVIPGIPTIQKDFSTTSTIASWITSAFLIVGAAVSPLFGKLGDIYGKKKVFLTILLLYIAGVGLAGFASNIYVLIVTRALQGVGFAIIPLGIAIITDVFPKEKVATAQGIISATFSIGSTLGLVIGAYIIEDLSWQWGFHTAFILSIVLFFAVAIMLKKDTPGQKSKVDFTGATMLMSGIVLVLLYLTEVPSLGWLSLENIAFLIVGLILAGGFFVFEGKQVNPLISVKLLKIRNVLVANLVGILSSLIMFLTYLAVVYYAQYPAPYGLGLSIIQTGLMIAPATVVMIILSPIMGRLVTKIGPKPILSVGATISIVGLLMLICFRGTIIELAIDVIVTLAGVIGMFIPLINMVAMSVPPENRAVGLGMNTMLRNVGGAIGPVVATTIIATHYGNTAFNLIFIVGIALAIAVIALSLTVKNYTFKTTTKKP
ncbi:MAG: MFS transporter [Candidatus Bathyarchaeia archaeon]|jgi:EmrB/QacA subfamily drug resistance transporter